MTNSNTYDGIALLPLPDEVLVPHTTLPVELEGRRYRAVEAAARSNDDLIALATADDESLSLHPDDDERIVGIGEVIQTEELEGAGRVLFVRGRSRATVTEEFDVDAPLRQVRARVLDEHLESLDAARDLIWSIRGGLLILQDRGVEGAKMLNYEVAQMERPSAIADVVGAAIFTDASGKRRLLEQLDILARLQTVDGRLADLVVQAYETNPPEMRERN